MGWSSGSSLAEKLIESIEANVEDDVAKRQLLADLIEYFELADCDTLNECLGVSDMFDEIWNELNPPEEWDDYED